MMNRILSTVLFFVFGLIGVAAQSVIKFDRTNFNFGKFSEDKSMSTVFYFINTGDKPLVIQQAMSTCGCTVANYTKTPIAPGKKGQVKVTYNGKGKPEGYFKKVITIRSNASNALTRLYIEGTMTVKE